MESIGTVWTVESQSAGLNKQTQNQPQQTIYSHVLVVRAGTKCCVGFPGLLAMLKPLKIPKCRPSKYGPYNRLNHTN